MLPLLGNLIVLQRHRQRNHNDETACGRPCHLVNGGLPDPLGYLRERDPTGHDSADDLFLAITKLPPEPVERLRAKVSVDRRHDRAAGQVVLNSGTPRSRVAAGNWSSHAVIASCNASRAASASTTRTPGSGGM